MKVVSIELREVEIPLRFPFETSFGTWRERRALLVIARDGREAGYGEVTAHEDPFYSYETIETARAVLVAHLVPAVLGRELSDPAEIAPRLAFVRGHPMAKAGLEGALRDLLARRRGVSLSESLGGTRARVEAGVSLGIEPSGDALVERVRAFVDAGYRRVKVKIKPGHDAAPLAAVRDAFPGLELWADANAAYTPRDAAALAALDSFGLGLVEQPLAWDDLVEHAALAQRIQTPIALDESITGLAAARAAFALAAARVVNVKLGRVSGAAESVAIHDAARTAGVSLFVGGMLETCIGRLHNLALASLPGFTLAGDLSGSDRYFEVDLVDPPIRVERGTIAVPEGPGIGARVDHGALDAVSVGSHRLDSPGG